MATDNALSNYQERKFLNQFVTPSEFNRAFVIVPFGTLNTMDTLEEGLPINGTDFAYVTGATQLGTTGPKALASVAGGIGAASLVSGAFNAVPARLQFDMNSAGTVLTDTICNSDQLDFGVLGGSDAIVLTGYYVFEGTVAKAADGSAVTEAELVTTPMWNALTGEFNYVDYKVNVDINAPCFYGTLNASQTVNSGIDILIKKRDIKFSMN